VGKLLVFFKITDIFQFLPMRYVPVQVSNFQSSQFIFTQSIYQNVYFQWKTKTNKNSSPSRNGFPCHLNLIPPSPPYCPNLD